MRAFAAFVLATFVGSAGQAMTVEHSGYLLDGADRPVTGSTPMTFALYDAAVSGTLLWSGDAGAGAACGVAVTAGYYTVLLGGGAAGCGASIPASAFAGGLSPWLQVMVGNAILSPRTLLARVPVATLALSATTADGLACVGCVTSAHAPGLAALSPASAQGGALNVSGAVTTGTQFNGSGAGLTNLPAGQLIGSLPGAALTGTYAQPVSLTNASNAIGGSGAGLTALPAGQLTGTAPSSAISGTYSQALALSNPANTYAGTFTGIVSGTAGSAWTMPTGASAPATCGPGNRGAVYFDTGVGALQVCNGIAWSTVGSAGSGTGPVNPSFGPVQYLFYAGGDSTFTVPAGVTSVDVKAWGAGGGGATTIGAGGNGQSGGPGGFTSGTISVTAGEALTVIVGGGGRVSGAGGYGGGGNGGWTAPTAPAAGGGGRTAIRRSSGTELLTAGGGGGGNVHGVGCTGGAGGGTTGGVGTNGNTSTSQSPGGGGTASAGGAAGNSYGNVGSPGTQYNGGNGGTAGVNGGGGGGGWYGGGGGPPTSSPGYACSGGGGSGYFGGTGVSGGQTLSSTSPTPNTFVAVAPPMTADLDYLTGAGAGGGVNQDGGPGLVVIRWAGPAPVTPALSANTVHGSQAIAYTGVVGSFAVPAGVTALQVKAWGAAGGGIGQPGGPGGFTNALVAVTPNESLTVYVGGGGKASGTAGYGGGGAGGSAGASGGGGGGRTALVRGGTELLTAGGGGGGINHGSGMSGGAGGGLTGGVGTNGNSTVEWSGGGGTQVVGGAGGNCYGNSGNAGGPLQGGNGGANGAFGGGGGGGWYGGGGGAPTCSPGYTTGGGGGSGYVRGPGVVGNVYASGQTPNGNVTVDPPGTTDADYLAPAGRGSIGDGKDGYVVIRW